MKRCLSVCDTGCLEKFASFRNRSRTNDHSRTGRILCLRATGGLWEIGDMQLFREKKSKQSTKVRAKRPLGSMGRRRELLHVLITNEI